LPSREEKIARQSVKSSVIITAGNLISRVFLLIGSLLVARLLGPSSYGIYSLALALPLFLQYLAGFGIKTAVNRFVPYHTSQGDYATAQRLTKNAIIFLTVTSLALTGLSVALAGWMSALLLDRPELTLYVEIANILILGQAFYNFLTPAFVSWGLPVQDAIWTIAQAILKVVISVVLILIGMGVFGGLDGYTLSALVSGILGTIVLYIMRLKGRPSVGGVEVVATKWNFQDFVNDVRMMVKYGFPAYIGNIILNASQQSIFTIVLAYVATNRTVGLFSAASNITQGVLAVSAALTPAFFTAFASLDGIKSDLGSAFKYAIKYVSYFMMPLVIFLIAASGSLTDLVYGRAYAHSSYFLELLALAYIPYAFGYSVLIPFVNGVGNSRLNMFMDIIESVATIVPIVVLVVLLKLGVNGLLYSIIISNVAPTIFGLYASSKYHRAKVDYANLFNTFFVSLTCLAAVYLVSFFVLGGVSSYIVFPIDLAVYLGLFLTLMPLTRAVREEDVARLRSSSRGLGAINKLLDPILSYENFLIEHITTKRLSDTR
jgi:O-antigen/teichoic acid export membrane protein